MKKVLGFVGAFSFFLFLGGCTPKIETKDLTANDWIIEGEKKDDPNMIASFSDHVVSFSVDTSSIPSSSKDEWEALGEEFAKQLLDQMSYKFEYTLKDNTMVWKKDGKISKKDATYTVAKDEKNLILTPKDSKDKKDDLILKPYTKKTKSEDNTKTSSSDIESTESSSASPSAKTYATAAEAETALNSGEDLTGSIITFTVDEFEPNSAFGYNMMTGEHLNFVSSSNPNVGVGDTVTVKVTSVSSTLGSFVINYEMQ